NGRMNLTVAKPLVENQGVSFIGTQKNGPFNIPGHLAREWLQLPANPNGCPNSDVLRPWANGIDIVRRATDTWIIDFGTGMSAEQAAFYEQPFEYARQIIKPTREGKREERANLKWWILQRSRPKMRDALKPFDRYILTPRVSKYRLFGLINVFYQIAQRLPLPATTIPLLAFSTLAFTNYGLYACVRG
ncbi:MAG: hypothetical protein DRR19_01610, partial [Candidatus Parabeggiatoa sp. nov. 1]